MSLKVTDYMITTHVIMGDAKIEMKPPDAAHLWKVRSVHLAQPSDENLPVLVAFWEGERV